MAYKIMEKDKTNKESKNVETTTDKGVNSTDLLGVYNIIYVNTRVNYTSFFGGPFMFFIKTRYFFIKIRDLLYLSFIGFRIFFSDIFVFLVREFKLMEQASDFYRKSNRYDNKSSNNRSNNSNNSNINNSSPNV